MERDLHRERAQNTVKDLEGRTALVSGSTTGLGLEIASALGARGARIALNYSHQVARAQTALERVRARGIEAQLFRASVVNPSEVAELFAQIDSGLGPVDILVINATPDQPQRPIEEYDWEDYQAMLDFFVKSPYLLTRTALPYMRSQGWGRIINITSEVVQRAPAHFSAYVAAKGAQEAWTRAMARELAPDQITVNMVSPGWIPVERHESDPVDVKQAYLEKIPMGRWGIPSDVASAVTFLASESAGFITGQRIGVSGGMTIS